MRKLSHEEQTQGQRQEESRFAKFYRCKALARHKNQGRTVFQGTL